MGNVQSIGRNSIIDSVSNAITKSVDFNIDTLKFEHESQVKAETSNIPSQELVMRTQRHSTDGSIFSLTDIDKFNFNITANKRWGMENAHMSDELPLVAKLKVSKANKHQWNRCRRQYFSSQYKEHLPPPSIGKIMGHGMI